MDDFHIVRADADFVLVDWDGGKIAGEATDGVALRGVRIDMAEAELPALEAALDSCQHRHDLGDVHNDPTIVIDPG